MDTHLNPSLDTASADAVSPFGPRPAAEAAPARIGWFEGHMPDVVDPLDPLHPQTAFFETRHMRHDGWTPEKMRLFLARLAECGVVKDACQAAAMSARAAYNLRDRDPLFAAGWEAAGVMARSRLADEAYSRSINGVMERIYKDGVIVAERHRYDNKLTMSVLGRLDARIDRAEERGDPHLRLVARWDDYLDALASGRREEGLALLAPPEPPLPPARPRRGPRPTCARPRETVNFMNFVEPRRPKWPTRKRIGTASGTTVTARGPITRPRPASTARRSARGATTCTSAACRPPSRPWSTPNATPTKHPIAPWPKLSATPISVWPIAARSRRTACKVRMSRLVLLQKQEPSRPLA
jgi:hypothetical protein